MSNQVCPGVPVAAIGKMAVSSVSGDYGAADTFSNDRIDVVRQKTCQGCALLGERFSASYRFSVIDPKVYRSCRKISFGIQATLNGKFSKFRYERFMRTRFMYSCKFSWHRYYNFSVKPVGSDNNYVKHFVYDCTNWRWVWAYVLLHLRLRRKLSPG